MKGHILVVDDEKGQRDILHAILQKEGYGITTVSGAREAIEQLEREEFDVVLTDLKMKGLSGLELLDHVIERNPQQCVLIMTAHGTIDSAVEAMKKGAFDYLEKPLDREDLLLTLQRAVDHVKLLRENKLLHLKLAESMAVPTMIGEHPKIKEVFRIINKIAHTNSTVLISGESGTGKELVARAVHDLSSRRARQFFAINCAAIPESLIESELFGHEKGAFTGATTREVGLFEVADGGTLFLDEIGEMNVAMQAKLLRAIQLKEVRRVGGKSAIPVDVRIISATNKNLEEEIRKGAFREDLFYRLNVIRIALPPLRERGSDIIMLADFFVKKFCAETGIPEKKIGKAALKLLVNYSWPGNVRQLESVLERGVLLAEHAEIEPEDLPAEIHCREDLESRLPFDLPPEGISMEELERTLIQRAMDRSGGIISKAAPLLGMSYKTLQYRLEKFGIQRNDGTSLP